MILPMCLAVPLTDLAKLVGRNPIVDYASLVLNNWQMIDPKLPLTLENLKVIWSFTKSKAEEWFYLIHVVIESYGAESMRAAKIIAQQTGIISKTSLEDRPALIKTILKEVKSLTESIRKINSVVKRLEENCQPHHFFDIVRPWLSGWGSRGGVIYEGVSDEALMLGGGSGA